MLGRGLRVVGGQAHHGQQLQFLLAAGTLGGAAAQEALWVVDGLGGLRADALVQQAQRQPGSTRAALFKRQAGLLPDILAAQPFAVDQGGGEHVATRVGLFLVEPGFATGIAHITPAEVVDQQRPAADLAVVVHAKARVVAGQVVEVAAAAQFQQPVVAQPVFDIAALPALVEGLDLGHAGVGQSAAQIPVLDPGQQRVAAGLHGGAGSGELAAVTFAGGLARVDHGAVAGRAPGLCQHQLGPAHQQGQRQQRGGQRGAERACSVRGTGHRSTVTPRAHGRRRQRRLDVSL